MSENLSVFAHRRVGFAKAPAHFPADRIFLNQSLHAMHEAFKVAESRPG